MSVIDIVVKERKLKHLSVEVNEYIVSIVKAVEEYNIKRGIAEVNIKHHHFKNSHKVLVDVGFDDKFDIIKFRIKLNKVSKFKWFWNPNLQLVHEYYWDWNDKSYANNDATVEMYEELINRLKIVLGDLSKDIKDL